MMIYNARLQTCDHHSSFAIYRYVISGTADIRLRRTTRTKCHIYTLLLPGDGLLASPKHVKV
jgi:hypothetical protein